MNAAAVVIFKVCILLESFSVYKSLRSANRLKEFRDGEGLPSTIPLLPAAEHPDEPNYEGNNRREVDVDRNCYGHGRLHSGVLDVRTLRLEAISLVASGRLRLTSNIRTLSSQAA
jgi:hypothetical protein